jgi:Cu/Ag efflux protein CusF
VVSRIVAVLVIGAAATASTTIAGTVVAVDRAHGLLSVEHGAEPGMPMAMTMVVRLRAPRALATLKPGMRVRLRCDATPNPWVCDLKR